MAYRIPGHLLRAVLPAAGIALSFARIAGAEQELASGGQAQTGLRADPELRPFFELGAQAGFNHPASSADVGGGPSAGAVLLLRPIAALALGAGAEVMRFSWLSNEHILARTYGLRLRIYGAFPSALDAYVEGMFGYTELAASSTGQCNADGGVALGLAVGVEGYLSQSLRAGGLLGYTTAETGPHSCSDVYIENAGPSVPNISPGITIRATATFGR